MKTNEPGHQLTVNEAKKLHLEFMAAAGVSHLSPQDVGALNQRLDSHEKWLATGGVQGQRLVVNSEDLTGMDFSHRNLSCAEFNHCTIVASNFYDVTLGESKLPPSQTKLFKCTVKKCIFSNAMLTGTLIVECDIDECNFLAARLVRVSASGTRPNFNDDYGHAEGIAVGNDFSMCHIVESKFNNFNWANSNFDKCNLELSWFHACYFGPADFSKARPNSSLLFEQCYLRSANFSGLLIEGSKFLQCMLMGASFHRTLAKQSNFTQSRLENADFSDADVSECVWEKVLAQQASFARSGMHHAQARLAVFRLADFRDCQLYSSDLSGSDLEYAKIDATTNKNLVNFSGCTWLNGRHCKAESIGVCYEE